MCCSLGNLSRHTHALLVIISWQYSSQYIVLVHMHAWYDEDKRQDAEMYPKGRGCICNLVDTWLAGKEVLVSLYLRGECRVALDQMQYQVWIIFI